MNSRTREVAIYGCGGQAVSVAEVLLDTDPSAQLTFVDPNGLPGETIFNFSVVTEVEPSQVSEYFVAIGSNERRRQKLTELRSKLSHAVLAKIVAKDADLYKDVDLEEGCFIGHRAHIGPKAHILENTIVNTRSIVEHEVEIGPNSQIAPGAIVGGRTKVGKNVFIGLGAVILDRLTVGDDVTIGASATVVKSIEEPGTYIGTPARRIA